MDNRLGSKEKKKGFFKKAISIGGMMRAERDLHALGGEELLRGIGWAMTAFFLGVCRMPFSVYPLGMAFLCASDTYMGFSLFGLAIAAFFLPIPWGIYLAAIALTLFMRILTRLFVDIPVRSREVTGLRGILEHIHGRLFCESVYLRMTCSCVAVFMLSLYAIVAGGFRYYDLFGAFFSMVVAPVATFFYCSFSGDMPISSAWLLRIRHLAKSLLAFSLCLSFGGMSLAGVSLGMAAAFVATLILCRGEGLLLGLLTSLLCGLSCGISYFAIFPVVAVVAFCLFEMSPYLAALVSAVVGGVTGVLLGGRDDLLGIFLPLMLGASVYCTFEKLFVGRGAFTFLRQSRKSMGCELMRLEKQHSGTCEDIDGLCHSLKTLSASLSRLSANLKKPMVEDLKHICDEAFASSCLTCQSRRHCLEACSALMAETKRRMVFLLGEGVALEKDKLPAEFYRICENAECLVERVNTRGTYLTQNATDFEKTGVFAADYGTIADAFLGLLENVKERYREDEKKTVAVRDKLREIGFEAAEVSVCGEGNPQIFISGLSPIPEHKRLLYLQKQLGRTLDCTLTLPLLTLDGDTCFMYTEREVCFEVSFGTALTAKEGVCGDSVSVFEDATRNLFYTLINDGMGTGEDAALTSKISSEILQSLLGAGVGREQALRMLNSFLSLGRNSGSTESSTTVDLFCLDKLTGRAIFLKSGAAPTYVKRGTNIFKLNGATLPVGILTFIDAKQIEFDTRDGDIIVQMSDGVTQEESECLWLLNYLNSTLETDPENIAEYIKEAALTNGSGDDISVVVTKIRHKI